MLGILGRIARQAADDAAIIEEWTLRVGPQVVEQCHTWARTTPFRHMGALVFCCECGGPENIIEVAPGHWENTEELIRWVSNL